jgi:hypothetical protein
MNDNQKSNDHQVSVNDLKLVEYYAGKVNAWFNTKFEHDKSLLTLSAGGIGLLITLLSTKGVNSIESLILYVVALFAFIVCLGTLLWIFRRNAKHLENVIQGLETRDSVLAFLDNTALASFLLGVLFSSIIGVSAAVHSYQEKEQKMTQEKSQKNQQLSSVRESVNGVDAIAPPSTAQSSVNGVSKLNPTTSAPTSAPTPAPDTAPPNTSEKK